MHTEDQVVGGSEQPHVESRPGNARPQAAKLSVPVELTSTPGDGKLSMQIPVEYLRAILEERAGVLGLGGAAPEAEEDEDEDEDDLVVIMPKSSSEAEPREPMAQSKYWRQNFAGLDLQKAALSESKASRAVAAEINTTLAAFKDQVGGLKVPETLKVEMTMSSEDRKQFNSLVAQVADLGVAVRSQIPTSTGLSYDTWAVLRDLGSIQAKIEDLKQEDLATFKRKLVDWASLITKIKNEIEGWGDAKQSFGKAVEAEAPTTIKDRVALIESAARIVLDTRPK